MSLLPSLVTVKASHSPSGETVRSGVTARPDVSDRTSTARKLDHEEVAGRGGFALGDEHEPVAGQPAQRDDRSVRLEERLPRGGLRVDGGHDAASAIPPGRRDAAAVG